MRALFLIPLLAIVACEKKKEEAPAPPPPVASASATTAAAVDAGPPVSTKVEFPEVPIRAKDPTTVHVAWKTPPGTEVNDEAPFRVRWNRSDALADAPSDVKATGTAAHKGFDIVVKPLQGSPNATLGGVIELVVCDSQNHSVCVPVKRLVDIEFVVGGSAAADTTVTIPLPQAHAN